MQTGEQDSPLASIYERELNLMRSMTDAHKEVAVAAAMEFCAEHQFPPPQWLVSASAELMLDLLKREKAQKRGRTGGHIARYRQDVRDLERWDAVLEIRRIREKTRRELKIYRSAPKRFGEPPKNLTKIDAWLKHGTFECASMYLTGRNARAGIDAMKASYQRVKKCQGHAATQLQHYPLDERFLKKIGLEGHHDRKPGTKWLPLHNLTP